MKKITWLFEGVDKVLAAMSAITLFIMMMWIFADVILRNVFNSPIQGTVELTGEYLMVILVYLMISNTHKFDGHVTVDVLQKKMSQKIKNVAKVITNLISASFFAFIAFLNFQEGIDYLNQNIKSIGILNYPLAPALFIISLGLAMITVRLLMETITILFPSVVNVSQSEKAEHDKKEGNEVKEKIELHV